MPIITIKSRNIILLVLYLFISISCSSSKDKIYKETRGSTYTLVSITVVAPSQGSAKKAIDAAFKEIERLEKLLNYYDKKSELSAINRNAAIKPVKVSEDMIDIIDKAIFVSKNTEGAFDITMGPVISLWDFFKEKNIPDEKLLKQKLALVGYKNIILNKKDKTIFFKKKDLEINMGGIIKGYTADRAVAILKKNGIKAAIVANAGDIKTFGSRPDGKPWNVGIQNPRPLKNDDIIAVASLQGEAISTSGDYERFFEKNGKRYHHLLSPKTGFPSGDCRSVTVITDKAAYTDAFSTGIFILGLDKGMAVLRKLGFEGIFIDKDGKIHVTEGIKDRIKLSNGALE
jgi:thiamine biosynthesis lipoprotein